MKKADKALQAIDFEIVFRIEDLMPRITGSQYLDQKEDTIMNLFGNQKVISAGLSDYKLHINKDRTELSINVGGINVRTHFSFFKIYQFMETNTLIMKTYAENLKVQLSSQEYLNFIDPKKRGRTLAQGKELPPDEERKI